MARRHTTFEGPRRIVWALGETPTTVIRVLRHLGAPGLRDHVDIKKQRRILLADRGARVERVLTDNGACYGSREFARVLDHAGVAHRWTRPCRPQTN